MKKIAIKILCTVFVLSACLLSAERVLAQESKPAPDIYDKLAADSEMHYKMGLFHAKKGDPWEAIACLNTAIKLKPDYAEAYLNLGKVYHGAGDLQNANSAYQQAIKLKPDYMEAYGTLGYSYIQSENYEEAIKVSHKAIKLNPNYAMAHLTLGIAYLETGREEKAREEYEILKTLDPEAAKQLYGK